MEYLKETPYLDIAIKAMEEVVALDKPLYMRDFYLDRDELTEFPTSIHACNTPACIAGYAVLTLPADEWLNAHDFWCVVDSELQSVSLSSSIFQCTAYDRKLALEQFLLTRQASSPPDEDYYFLNDLLCNHPHLHIDYPTSEQALDYLQQIKKFVTGKVADN